MTRVRVGVLGCGMIAQLMHLPYLTELSDHFEVVALCDSSRALAERVAGRFRVSRVHESVDRMLDEEDLDAVVVLNRDHFEPARAALTRGLHVLTEKPLCYTVREAEQLATLAERTGRTLMVGYMKRYDDGVQRALEEIRAIRSPRLARVHIVVGPDYGNWIIPELQVIDRDPGGADTRDSDGRRPKVLAELGDVPEPVFAAYMDMLGVWSHDINLLRAAFPEHPESIKADVSDDGATLTALLRYADGLQCVFEGSSNSIHRFEESLTVWGADRVVDVEVPNPFLRNVSASVRISLDGPGDGRPPATERLINGSHEEAFKRQLRHFHRCVTDPTASPLTSGAEAVEDTRLMGAIIRAAAAGANRPGWTGTAAARPATT